MLLWCDDFRPYGFAGSATLMTEGLYAAQSSDVTHDPDPSGTGQPCITGGNATNNQTRRVFPATYNTVGLGFRLYLPALFGNDEFILWSLRDVSNNNLCSLSMRTTGAIIILDADGTVVAETDGPVIVARSKQHIEWKTTLDVAAGAVEVRVDGVTVLSADNLALTNTPAAQFGMHSLTGTSATSYYMYDLIAWDTSGARNNDFFGSVSVQTMFVNSDIALGGWTLTGGATGFGILSAVPPNDANFIEAAIPPVTPCSFGLTPLSADITSVRALMTLVRAKKTDGGDGSLQVSLLSDGDIVNGANRPITPSMTYWFDVQETDPHTGVAWTPVSANAALPEMNRTV